MERWDKVTKEETGMSIHALRIAATATRSFLLAVLVFALIASGLALAQSRDDLRSQDRPTAGDRSGDRLGTGPVQDPEALRFMRGMPEEFRAIYDPEGLYATESATDARLERIGDRQRLPERIRPFITNVTFDGSVPTVFFEVADENGNGVADIQSMNVGVSVVKLLPGSSGKTPHWDAYIFGSDQGVPQAGSSNQGTLENLGGGIYSFTLAQGLDEFAGVMFEPQLTHRIGIDLRNVRILDQTISNQRSGDSWFDVQPATGATEGIPTRRIAAQENCATCHADELRFHGGPRQTMEYCVTCHIDSDRDAGTGNSIGMTVMMHKIHMGPNLLEPYSIQSNRTGRFSDYSNVTYPQDVRNCTTCHDPGQPGNAGSRLGRQSRYGRAVRLLPRQPDFQRLGPDQPQPQPRGRRPAQRNLCRLPLQGRSDGVGAGSPHHSVPSHGPRVPVQHH